MVIDEAWQTGLSAPMTNHPPLQNNKRPFTLWHLLALNRHILWQLTIGATLAMLALSFALTGAPWGGLALGATAGGLLLWGGRNALYLKRNDLPLLCHGVLVSARISGMVKETSENLYRITYRLPDDSTERDGVFLAANESYFDEGEPVSIMINPHNPSQLIEISGRYEPLFRQDAA